MVKEDLVPEEDKLKEYATLILADGTVRIFQRAMVDVYTPYLCGRVKAFCMKTPVYDLIIGNVEGVRNVDAPDPHWDAERCAVTTRRQAKTEGQTIPLKVAEEVDLARNKPRKAEGVTRGRSYAPSVQGQGGACHDARKGDHICDEEGNPLQTM